MRPEDTHRLAALDEQRLVVFEPLERGLDGAVAVPIAGGFACATVNDQFVRFLCDLAIEIVHQTT